MRRVFASAGLVLAGALFVVTFSLHVATFLPAEMTGRGRFYAFLALLLISWMVVVGWYRTHADTLGTRILPQWARRTIIVLFLYFVLNGAVAYSLLKGGSPETRNGGYVLTNHGQVVRTLSETEYRRCLAWEMRFFTSAWMIGFASLSVYCGSMREGARRAPDRAPRP